MTKTTEPKISTEKSQDFTSVTFYPDLARFGMDHMEKDMVELFTRRAYDVGVTTTGVKVFLNGKLLPLKSFMDYVNLYVKGLGEETPKVCLRCSFAQFYASHLDFCIYKQWISA